MSSSSESKKNIHHHIDLEPLLHRVEGILAFLLILILALVPVTEFILQKFFQTGIPGVTNYISHIVLLIAFVGGLITSRTDQHLNISVGLNFIKGKPNEWLRIGNAFLTVTVNTALAWSSISLMVLAFTDLPPVGFIPIQVFVAIMPISFIGMAIRSITTLKADHHGKLIASIGFFAGTFFAFSAITNMLWELVEEMPLWIDAISEFWYVFMEIAAIPLIIILIISIFFGTPIFVVLSGIAFFLFANSGGSVEVVPEEAYGVLTTSNIPAIPLFTLVGFLLSESKAGERMVKLFKSFFGWMPGGLAVAAVLASAFFTTFTGASGVTILALGGLLSYVLVNSGKQSEEFSTGILTASGSIGLLFPPSLAIIVYASTAHISIIDMFIGGLIPGFLLVLAMSLTGVFAAVKNKTEREKFSLPEMGKSLLSASLEIALPVIVVVGYFSGFMGLIQTAGIAVLYVLFVEVVIHREIKVKELPKIALKSIPIIGGVLIIIALAQGLKAFIIDAYIPMMFAEWVQNNITSKIIFLILLNIALLITGCFMDIFSATMVVAPLIIPLGEVFGIHPVHLGIIFIANMELGFMTPPIGLNLFLASYSFDKPLSKIYKNVLPFFFIQLIIVLIITYVPIISTGLLEVFK